jgi:Kef-type K+ transport system membrane component KefB
MPELAPLTTIATVLGTVGLAWSVGRLTARCGLPAVLGELAAGLALGPSVLGVMLPDSLARVFTPDVTSLLTILAHAAVLLFMLLVGLELNVGTLRREAGGIARIALASLVTPFVLGALAAIWAFPRYHGPAGRLTPFVLFVGTALAVTAMPVLGRILADLRAQRSDVGTVALACAALDDAAAWTLLGVVVAMVHGEARTGWTLVTIAGFLIVMFIGARPILAVAARRAERAGTGVWIAGLAAAAGLAAWGARAAGMDAVFGPFLVGAMAPRGSDRLAALERGLRRISAPLLPAFFVLIGLRTNVREIAGAADWLALAMLIVVAFGAKAGAGALSAAAAGFPWRKAFAIGALLNTRGLVALVVLDVGRSLGILSPALFTMFVIMAFVTTLATVPLLFVIGWPQPAERSGVGPPS